MDRAAPRMGSSSFARTCCHEGVIDFARHRPARRRADGVAWAPIAAFCFLWSSAFAAAKIAVRDCPPLTLLTIRFLIAGALMLGVAAASGRWSRPGARDLAALVLLGS